MFKMLLSFMYDVLTTILVSVLVFAVLYKPAENAFYKMYDDYENARKSAFVFSSSVALVTALSVYKLAILFTVGFMATVLVVITFLAILKLIRIREKRLI